MTFNDYARSQVSPDEFLTYTDVKEYDPTIENVSEDRLLNWMLDECDLTHEDLEDLYDEGLSVHDIAQNLINAGHSFEL